jgi:GNAT superfamily N-acetyltransferase
MELFPMNMTLVRNILGTTTAQPEVFIRPVQQDDVEQILAMHRRLSNDSLYNRYHIARIPTRQEIERIIELDGEKGRVMIATVSGRVSKIVGMAYYIVTDEGTAETAFLVEDLYQGQGIGRRFMNALSQAAKAESICFFDSRVLPSNKAMLRLLYLSGQLVHKKRDYDAFEMRTDICQVNE